MCSPNCHKEIYDKPVYLVMNSDKPEEHEVLYVKEGLKDYKPKDKVTLFNVIGKAVGIVFTKYDLPVEKYRHVIDTTDVKDPDVPTDVPYVVITNEEGLVEVNRDEKYDKVAEMEVSTDGKVTRIVVKNRLEDEIVEKSNGRKIEPVDKEENTLLKDENIRFSLSDLLKYLSKHPAYFSKPEYSQYNPFYTQSSMDDFLKYYFSRPFSQDSSMYPSKYDQSFLGNVLAPNKVQYSGYGPSKYWNYPSGYESMNMNFYPGFSSKHWYPPQNYESLNMDFGYNPKHWYPSHGQSYDMGYFSGQGRPEYGPAPGYSSSFNPMQGFSDSKFPSYWQNEYEPYSKPFYNGLYYGQSGPSRDKFMEMNFNPQAYSSFSNFYPSGMNYGSNVRYPLNATSNVPVWQSTSQMANFPLYSGSNVPESYSSGKNPYLFPPQYSNLYQTGTPYTPYKYGFPHSPGVTYIVNICGNHKPHYVPEVEAPSMDHGPYSSSYRPTKPEPEPMVHKPVVAEQSPKLIPSLKLSDVQSPSEESLKYYEPRVSFRNILYQPYIKESDEPRKITVRPKPTDNKINHPIHHIYSQPQFSPPPSNLNRPPPNSLPSGFVAVSQP